MNLGVIYMYHFLNIVTDDYKPDEDGDDDDDDESCSSGVDENELEEDSHSEEDIDDIVETVLNVWFWHLPVKEYYDK